MSDSLARELMDDFASATGITGRNPPRRYLWTDAFAVCNFLGLYRRSTDRHYLTLATAPVDQVHQVLGRHRPDDGRRGWISGLGEDEGRQHPTAGGLRIGKPQPERRPSEPPHERSEWDQDGQYFHYLSKWAHALLCMASQTGDTSYSQWAAELMVAAHRSFVGRRGPGGALCMVWKMSIDLTRPLVASMGQLDPLDGLVTLLEIQSLVPDVQTLLAAAIDDFTRLCEPGHWLSDDPLGVGGLLDDAARLTLIARAQWRFTPLLPRLWLAADRGLVAFRQTAVLEQPHRYRLAFRELGLAIGLAGLSRLTGKVPADAPFVRPIKSLRDSTPLAESINAFWCDPAHRRGPAWTEHGDINAVMLATSLSPAGYLAADPAGQ